MLKRKDLIIGFLFLICFLGTYLFININAKNNFSINGVSYNADAKYYTDKTKNNVYDIKFFLFHGTEVKEVSSKKAAYNISIHSNVDDGDLNIKIYNGTKIFFDENGSIDKTISINENNGKHLMIELKGKKAKGHVKIKFKEIK